MERILSSFASASSPAPGSDTTPITSPTLSVSGTKIKVPKWVDTESLPITLTNTKRQCLRMVLVDLSGVISYLFTLQVKLRTSFKVPVNLRHYYGVIKGSLLNWLGDTPSQATQKWWTATRRSGETYSSFYSRLINLNIHRMEGAPDRQSVLDCALLSRFMHSLPPDAFDFVFARNPNNGREVVNYATEFVQSRSYNRHSLGQCYQPNSGRGTDSLRSTSGGEAHVSNIDGTSTPGATKQSNGDNTN